MIRAALLASLALLLASPAAAAARFDGSFAQGSLVVGHAASDDEVVVDGRPVRVDAAGRFVFGLGRDHAPRVEIAITGADGVSRRIEQEVAPRDWPVQRIDGLPDKSVNPDPQTLARIKAEQAEISKARAFDRPASNWTQGFGWPVKGRISGVFGSQRILNGEPRAPHAGLDIAVPAGTPVRPAAAGVVALAEPDLYFTGGTLIIDHGAGVFSVYAHLSKLEVEVGQQVGRDSEIALSGMTGRATGPHLHFGLYWFATALDPASVLPPQ